MKGRENDPNLSFTIFQISLILLSLLLLSFDLHFAGGEETLEKDFESGHDVINISALQKSDFIRIDWTFKENTSGMDPPTYELRRSILGSQFTRIKFIKPQEERSSSYFDEEVIAGRTYSYKISKLIDSVYYDESEIVKITISGPPEEVMELRSSESVKKITLQWDPPRYDGGSPIKGYIIRKGYDYDDHMVEVARLDANTTEWINDRDPDSRKVVYSITAFNEFGESEPDYESFYSYNDADDEVDTIILVTLLLMFVQGAIFGAVAHLKQKSISKRKNGDVYDEIEGYIEEMI